MFTKAEWKHHIATLIISVIGGTVAGLFVGVILFWVQREAARPFVSYKVDISTAQQCSINLSNQGHTPAYGIILTVKFDRPIASHEQPGGIFTCDGTSVDSRMALSGRDQATIRCDILPSGTRYPIVFLFSEPLARTPSVNVITSEGAAHEE